MPQSESEQKLNVHRIYTKESSCLLENAPQVFRHKGELQHEMKLQFNHTQLDEKNHYEVELDIGVTTSVKQNQDEGLDKKNKKVEKHPVISVIKVKQAGIFQIKGFEDKQIDQLLKVYCPELLYPYARHVVAELVVMSSMPSVTLQPISFFSLYQKEQEHEESQTK